MSSAVLTAASRRSLACTSASRCRRSTCLARRSRASAGCRRWPGWRKSGLSGSPTPIPGPPLPGSRPPPRAPATEGDGVAAYDIALNSAQRRTQFGGPIAKNQMIQSVLVEMLGEVTAMQLYCIRLGRLIDDGKMSETMASLAKYFCSVKARHVCRMARDILGGNGILLDFHVMRHMCDMEALVTYEGTAEIQTLLVGRDITGQSAFT